jgi:hypothetical protein
MRKKTFKYTIRIAIVFITIIGGMESCSDSHDPIAILKHRIDNAKMVEYVDSSYSYKAKVLYPDFFQVDSIGKDFASFSYSDKDLKVLRLCYRHYPPRLLDSSHEVVKFLSDSLNVCLREKRSSVIMKGEDDQDSSITYLKKCSHTIHGWSCYTLTYEKRYEDAVGRLTEIVKDWKIYGDQLPEWVQDALDFLDI